MRSSVSWTFLARSVRRYAERYFQVPEQLHCARHRAEIPPLKRCVIVSRYLFRNSVSKSAGLPWNARPYPGGNIRHAHTPELRVSASSRVKRSPTAIAISCRTSMAGTSLSTRVPSLSKITVECLYAWHREKEVQERQPTPPDEGNATVARVPLLASTACWQWRRDLFRFEMIAAQCDTPTDRTSITQSWAQCARPSVRSGNRLPTNRPAGCALLPSTAATSRS